MPNLLREVEKQLGLTAGGLKKFVTDGQLSNKKFFDAILASQKALTQQANSSASTIEQANQRVANSFTSLIGAIDDKLGASKFFTGFIDGLASGIDKLSNFLGLTTQATSGRGANLDQVIRGAAPSGSQYAFPTIGAERITESIGRFPNYVQEINSLEELKSLEVDLLFVREDQAKQIANAVNSNKETIDILGAQNVPLKEAQGYLDLENKLLDSIIQKRKIELHQNEENLTYLEKATNYLKEQFELSDRTAGAIISGVSGAGPNASRGVNVLDSKSLTEAGAKLILSNEKVAAAIEEYFTLLFDTLDPFIDILGDLISAINRLIGALIQNATNAAEGLLDTVGLGPNGYIFGGGLARDLEDAFGSRGRQPAGPSSLQLAYAQADAVFVAIEQEASTLEALQPKIDELVSLSENLPIDEIINSFVSSTRGAIDLLREEAKVFEDGLKTSGPGSAAEIFGDYFREELAKIEATISEIKQKEAIVVESLIGEITSLSEIGLDAQSEIDAINRQNLSQAELIELRRQEDLAIINQNRSLLEKIDNETSGRQLLNAINEAEEKSLQLYNLQISELRKLNEEREREANLLLLQNAQSGLQKILADFEKAIIKIGETVEGVFDQITDLLFSDFSLLGPREQFDEASKEYQKLLETAFQPDATEEDIENFQAFVNQYLSASRDVYKSSTEFQNIFEGVLDDLALLGLSYGLTAPSSAVDNTTSEISELSEELGVSFEDLIKTLNNLKLEFATNQIEFIGESLGINLSDVVTIQVPDSPVSLTLSSSDVSLTKASDFLKSLTLNSSDVSVALDSDFSKTITFSAGNFSVASLPQIDLGSLTATFDSSGLSDAMNLLNRNIADAVNSLLQTLDSSNYAIESTSGTTSGTSSGTTTVTASTSGFKPIQSNITGVGGGAIELMAADALYNPADAEAIIQQMINKQVEKYGSLSNIVADTSYAVVSGMSSDNNGGFKETTIAYASELKSDLEYMIDSILRNTDLEFLGGFNLSMANPSSSTSNTTSSTQTALQELAATGQKPFYSTTIGKASTYAYAYGLSPYRDLAYALAQAIENDPSLNISDFKYGITHGEIGSDRKTVAFYPAITIPQQIYEEVGGSRTNKQKYGFRYGGIVDALDTIPAMLSPGEYILSPETVRRYGLSNLNRLNSGDSAAINATSDPEVKRLLAELIVAVKENDTEVNVYTDMKGQTKAGIEEFRSELRERTRRQGDQYVPARYI